MIGAILSLLIPNLAITAGEPPRVRYVVKLGKTAWEPIALPELEPVIEAKTLARLTKGGTMRIEKSGWADLATGDYALTIEGRFIEDAESFSIYLGFGKGTRDDLPSLHVAETVGLQKANRAEMEKRIQDGTTRAAERMAELLDPRLEAVRLKVPQPLVEGELTTTWGPVDIPSPVSPGKMMKQLLDVTEPDHERFAALASVAPQAFDQPAARDAIIRAVLLDPSSDLRGRAASALAPVARTHVPTQRLILHAMRNELDDNVLGELTALSQTFPGLSRKEALETWLELVSAESTPPSSASKIAQLLAEEENIPNIDLAVARCLEQDALMYGKKSACAQWLLKKVPAERRFSVVGRYLANVRVWEQGEINTLGDVFDALKGGKDGLSPEVAAAMFAVAERPSAGRARRDAVQALSDHPAPSAALVERLVPLLFEPSLTSTALRTIEEWVSAKPELREMSLGAIKRVREKSTFLPKPSHGDPHQDMEEAIRRLERKK